MEKHFTKEQVKAIVEQSGFQIVTEESLPGQEATFLPLPSSLHQNLLALLRRWTAFKSGGITNNKSAKKAGWTLLTNARTPGS